MNPHDAEARRRRWAARRSAAAAAEPDRDSERQAAERRRQRDQQLRSLDERIGEAVSEAQASGELQRSPSWGRPLIDDGFLDAPPELRLAFKAMQNAGHVPAEVEMLQELQRWRDELAGLDPDGEPARRLRERIAERQLLVRLRIERLARTLTL